MSDRKRILVVDDDPHTVKILSDLFRSEGFDVDTGVDGLDAFLKGAGEQPDLIILDIMMPVTDGLGALVALKSTTEPEVPVFLLTCKDQPEDVREGYKLGADRYYTKPFDPEVLVRDVKEFLAIPRAKNRTQGGVVE